MDGVGYYIVGNKSYICGRGHRFEAFHTLTMGLGTGDSIINT